LTHRFELNDAEVLPDSALAEKAVIVAPRDVVVIDEAHRVVADEGREALAKGAAKLAADARHLLLLSATPVLHRDSELLALLELLDPDNYSTGDLEPFQTRTARRAEMGRAFLALQSADIAPLIKLNAKKLAELVPHDAVVQQLAESLAAPVQISPRSVANCIYASARRIVSTAACFEPGVAGLPKPISSLCVQSRSALRPNSMKGRTKGFGVHLRNGVRKPLPA
jgi:SNF2-related domain